MSNCKSGCWRRYTCTNVLLICKGEVGKLVQSGGMWGLFWGWLCGTSIRKELCLVPCHNFHIYWIWTSRKKKCGGCLIKSHQFGMEMEVTKEDSFHREGRFSLSNTDVLWNFMAILTRYILSRYITVVVLRVWGWQGQKRNSKCPNDINTEWAIPEIFLGF